jgi:periplasmic divalent cation tolerance protein
MFKRKEGTDMTDAVIVLITASSGEEAERIARVLVGEHVAACVNIMPGMRSLFFWEGKTQDEKETLLICKSRLPLVEKLVQRVKSLHSYSVPEVIALPIVAGSGEYLEWVRENTKE